MNSNTFLKNKLEALVNDLYQFMKHCSEKLKNVKSRIETPYRAEFSHGNGTQSDNLLISGIVILDDYENTH